MNHHLRPELLVEQGEVPGAVHLRPVPHLLLLHPLQVVVRVCLESHLHQVVNALKDLRHVQDVLCFRLHRPGCLEVRCLEDCHQIHHLEHGDQLLHDGEVEESEVACAGSFHVADDYKSFYNHLLLTFLNKNKSNYALVGLTPTPVVMIICIAHINSLKLHFEGLID